LSNFFETKNFLKIVVVGMHLLCP